MKALLVSFTKVLQRLTCMTAVYYYWLSFGFRIIADMIINNDSDIGWIVWIGKGKSKTKWYRRTVNHFKLVWFVRVSFTITKVMEKLQVEVGKKCLSMLACHKLSNPEANFLSGFTNSTKYFIMGTTKTWHEKRGSMHAYNDSYISNVIFHNYFKNIERFWHIAFNQITRRILSCNELL